MVKITEIMGGAIEWTAAVLFRPFNPKKWLILGFVAWMAGYAMSGGNLNLSRAYNKEKTKKAEAAQTSQVTPPQLSKQKAKQQSPASVSKDILNQVSAQAIRHPVVTVLLVMLTLLFMVTVIWLNSRFSFVFLEDVVNNDAAVRIPFKKHKKLGDSLFTFNLIYSLIHLVLFFLPIVLCIMAIARLGVFDKANTAGLKQVFFTCLPYALWLLFVLFSSSIISFITTNFVLVVMFKDKIKILEAWLRSLAIINANKLEVIKYLFVFLGLNFCARILCGLLSLAVFAGLSLPLGAVALLFIFIFHFIPVAQRLLYFIALFILVTPLALFLSYGLICLSLPFGVFFRTLSLKFIARLYPGYNLFRLTDEEVMA